MDPESDHHALGSRRRNSHAWRALAVNCRVEPQAPACTSGGQSCDPQRTGGPGPVAGAPKLGVLTHEPLDLLTLAMLPDAANGFRAVRDRGPLREILSHPDDHADVPRPAMRRQLRSGEARRAAEQELDRTRRAGVRLVAIGDPDYPALLTQICDPPPVLWVRGRPTEPAASRAVALVGSRAASAVGRELARQMAADLAPRGAIASSRGGATASWSSKLRSAAGR